MKLTNNGARRRVTQAIAAAAAALALAACGGGDRVSDYQPTRVIAFGDESSVLDDSAEPGNARKYSINPVFSATVDCHTHRNWVQYVAEAYHLYFPECSVGLAPGTATPSLMLAQPDADVAAVKAQVDAFLAGNTLTRTDLVMIYVGVHDVLNQYLAVKGGASEASALAAVGEAGSVLAAQVNRLSDAGGRVVLSLVPGLRYMPFGAAEEAALPADKPGELLGRLVTQFNDQVSLGIYNDGSRIGVVQFDDTVRVIWVDPNHRGYDAPADRAACLETHRGVNLLQCTTATLVPQAVNRAQQWLWADELRLSAQGQLLLGELALNRTRENPF